MFRRGNPYFLLRMVLPWTTSNPHRVCSEDVPGDEYELAARHTPGLEGIARARVDYKVSKREPAIRACPRPQNSTMTAPQDHYVSRWARAMLACARPRSLMGPPSRGHVNLTGTAEGVQSFRHKPTMRSRDYASVDIVCLVREGPLLRSGLVHW